MFKLQVKRELLHFNITDKTILVFYIQFLSSPFFHPPKCCPLRECRPGRLAPPHSTRYATAFAYCSLLPLSIIHWSGSVIWWFWSILIPCSGQKCVSTWIVAGEELSHPLWLSHGRLKPVPVNQVAILCKPKQRFHILFSCICQTACERLASSWGSSLAKHRWLVWFRITQILALIMFICLSLSPIASFPLSCPSATLLTASLPCSHLNSISSASSFFVHHPTVTVHNQSDVNNRQILFTLLLSGHVKVNLGPYKQRHQSGLKSGGRGSG